MDSPFLFVNRTDTATAVRNQIVKAIYDADSANVKAVLLVGSTAPFLIPEQASLPMDTLSTWCLASRWVLWRNDLRLDSGGGAWVDLPLVTAMVPLQLQASSPATVFLHKRIAKVGRIDFYNMPTLQN
ncbi:MAG: hypothetical protein R2877_04145 [Bdellovibrionota bacterium]